MESQQYGGQVAPLIVAARGAGVSVIVNIGTDLATSRASLALAREFPEVYATVGYHPSDAKNFTPELGREIEALLSCEKVVAVGEIGLDYYRDNSPRPRQREVFREQLEMAARNRMPVVIHDRDSFADSFPIAQEYAQLLPGVVFHCFGGDVAQARLIFDEGWIISVGGVVTYKNSLMAEVATYAPLDSIMLETDSPYLTPIPHRGQVNQPAFVRFVCARVAELKNTNSAEVERITDRVARRFYRLDERFDF